MDHVLYCASRLRIPDLANCAGPAKCWSCLDHAVCILDSLCQSCEVCWSCLVCGPYEIMCIQVKDNVSTTIICHLWILHAMCTCFMDLNLDHQFDLAKCVGPACYVDPVLTRPLMRNSSDISQVQCGRTQNYILTNG